MGYDRYSRGDMVMGVPRSAFRPSWIFLALLAIFAGSAVVAWREAGYERLAVFLFVISGYLISLCLHEFAHALLAYRAGDLGVAARGYLTLNPLKYTHPILSLAIPVVMLMVGGIGLPGGAVWVDHGRIRGKLQESLVSAVGPATNLALALVLAVPFLVGVDTTAHPSFWAAMAFLTFLELTAGLLNLAPVPGVDGGNMIRPWLNERWQRAFNHIAPYGMLIFFVLLFNPVALQVLLNTVFTVGDALQIPSYLYGEGFRLVKFWSS